MSVASDFFLGSGGGWRSPLLPVALKAKGGAGATSDRSAQYFPIRSTGTGRAMGWILGVYSQASTSFGWMDNGTVLVNVSLNTINSTLAISATGWTGGIWYDQVDDLFYFIVKGDQRIT